MNIKGGPKFYGNHTGRDSGDPKLLEIYDLCRELGFDSWVFIPGGIFFTQYILLILPNPLFLFCFLSYFIVDDSGMEMIGRALLGSGAEWSMTSTRPVAAPVPAVPVTYEGSINPGEKPVKVSNRNPERMKLTTPSFTEDLCSHHGSKRVLCFMPICRGRA